MNHLTRIDRASEALDREKVQELIKQDLYEFLKGHHTILQCCGAGWGSFRNRQGQVNTPPQGWIYNKEQDAIEMIGIDGTIGFFDKAVCDSAKLDPVKCTIYFDDSNSKFGGYTYVISEARPVSKESAPERLDSSNQTAIADTKTIE